ERGLLEVDAVRDPYSQVRGHVVDLRVHGVVASAACDPVSGSEVADTLPRGEHDAGSGISECPRLLEAGPCGRGRLRPPLAARLPEHLPNVLGPGASLAEQALPARLDLLPLGARGDEARVDCDQDAFGPQRGLRDIDDVDPSVAEPLRDLLHAGRRPSTNVW